MLSTSTRTRSFAVYTTFLLLAFILSFANGAGAALSENEQKLIHEISIGRMMATIEHLCADELRGRRAGSPEHHAAADYLASAFQASGLSAPDAEGFDGYKQTLTMRYALIRSKNEIKATLSYILPGKNGPVRRTKSFAYRRFNGNGGLDLDADVVFAGYGIHDPASGYDDYADLDVGGKIVMWLPGKPHGVKLSKPVSADGKVAEAFRRGAVACLVISSETADPKSMNIGLSGSIADFPCIAIDRAVVSELLPGLNIKSALKGEQHGLQAGMRGPHVRLQVTSVCDPVRKTCNIIGVLPGADPQAGNQVVMVGAHYDHIGDTARGEIFRGADDNASGTAVVLEVARAIHRLGIRPRRTIVFAAWTAEEAGLIGSNYFAAHPPFPLKDILSNVELDMVGIGTPGAFMTTGASTYPEHYRYLQTSADDLGITLKPDLVQGASDHLAFVRKKVPSSLIYSDGEHPHYHTIHDTPGTLNHEILESAARLAALAVWRAASQDLRQSRRLDK